MIEEDGQLARQAVHSAAAFLALYDRYFARVYTYFRYRSNDLPTCDDLTAQTFEHALVHIGDYCPERGAFAAWLFGIARNLANGHLRESLRRPLISLSVFQKLQSSDPAPEEMVVRSDEMQELQAGIRALPARQRDLLALKFSGRLTNRQIAAMTGLSEQNVAVLIHRSIQALRKKIAAETNYE